MIASYAGGLHKIQHGLLRGQTQSHKHRTRNPTDINSFVPWKLKSNENAIYNNCNTNGLIVHMMIAQ